MSCWQERWTTFDIMLVSRSRLLEVFTSIHTKISHSLIDIINTVFEYSGTCDYHSRDSILYLQPLASAMEQAETRGRELGSQAHTRRRPHSSQGFERELVPCTYTDLSHVAGSRHDLVVRAIDAWSSQSLPLSQPCLICFEESMYICYSPC